MHSLLTIIYTILKENKPYEEVVEVDVDRLDTEQVQRYHVRRLEEQGYTVSLGPTG